MDTERKTALITGASGGIGAEFAEIFAADGYDLVLAARSEDKMLSIKKELESKYDTHIEILAVDLARKDSALTVFGFTENNGIKIDALVNNAGFGDYGPFAECSWKKQEEMIQLNITTLMQLTHCYLPGMIERKYGRILNLGSIASFQAGPLMSVYYASKAFVLSFTEALHEELAGTGVRVCALCPGPVDTGFEKRAGRESLFENMKYMKGSAHDVAAYGYHRMLQNRLIVVPGFLNRMAVLGAKLAPRAVSRKIVHRIQK